MEVILQKDVDRLGKAFDIVKVKDGYALNYLIPRSLARLATLGNKKRIEADRKKFSRKEAALLKSAEEMVKKLEETSITITVKTGDGDHLYGSVSSQLISEKLSAEGFAINKKDIVLPEAIRTLGVYNVKVRLHHGISAEVKVWVVKEGKTEEEAVAPEASA